MTEGMTILKGGFLSEAKENLRSDVKRTYLGDFLNNRGSFEKRKVLLVLPNIVGDKIAATAPLPGVAYVAGFVREAGHDVRVLDMRVHKSMPHLYKELEDFKPDFIGLSFMTQHEFSKIYDFVSKIKAKFPDAKVIIGGAGASALYDKVLREANVDFAITREGEYSLVELMDSKPYEEITGLIWKKCGEIVKNQHRKFEFNIDELPFPAYDLFPMSQ